MKIVSALRFSLLVCLLVVATAPHAFAQSAKSEVVIPEGYTNDDIVAVYNDLKKNYGPKGEFETQAAYKKRIQSGYKGQVKFFFTKEIYAVMPPAGIGYIYSEYDADKQIVTFKRILKMFDNKVKIRRTQYSNKEYTASNAYGGKALVTSHEGTDYGILIENGSKFNGKIEIQLPPRDAEALKNNFGIMFVCELKPDSKKGYLKDDRTSFEASFSFPESYYFSEHYIRVNVTEVVFFNSQTGVVYSTQKIKT
ncbi:hypothetical protein [Prosthecochloris sp.]|uniref:hypothetical protein n=1 Tax=Prosthecochloris sp. TaxID=290513 RepID=UPI0025DDF028|nr:hypothetical protein [Prosthecochloris sp.]